LRWFTNWALIEGALYYDFVTIGTQQPISNQPVTLYRDGNGNGHYDGVPTDPLQDAQFTDAGGQFSFVALTAGTYFVVQPDATQ